MLLIILWLQLMRKKCMTFGDLCYVGDYNNEVDINVVVIVFVLIYKISSRFQRGFL